MLYGYIFFFFNDTATTEIYTLSLHDALPIYLVPVGKPAPPRPRSPDSFTRSEEHTSELQSPCNLVCRLLLEKKKYYHIYSSIISHPDQTDLSLERSCTP